MLIKNIISNAVLLITVLIATSRLCSITLAAIDEGSNAAINISEHTATYLPPDQEAKVAFEYNFFDYIKRFAKKRYLAAPTDEERRDAETLKVQARQVRDTCALRQTLYTEEILLHKRSEAEVTLNSIEDARKQLDSLLQAYQAKYPQWFLNLTREDIIREIMLNLSGRVNK